MHPNVPIAPTDMTFSVSRDGGAFEWKGDTIFTVFCQVRRVLDPSMWRMLYDILRFNASARRLVIRWKTQKSDRERREGEDIVIGDYLKREGYSQEFIDNYLIVSLSTRLVPINFVLQRPNAHIYTFSSIFRLVSQIHGSYRSYLNLSSSQ